MSRTATVFASLVVLVLPCRSTATQQRQSSDGTRLDSLARSFLAERATPGLSVFVLRRTDTLLLRGYGFADLENDVPATPRTVYRIGSLTKQFTAALVMQSVREGRIALDDTLQRFLPAFPTRGYRVTIRHLLTHTSGIRSFTSLPETRRTLRLDVPHDSTIATIAAQPFDFPPGERYLYNNSGYFLLGSILELSSGLPYDRLVRERLAGPLTLEDTRYCFVQPLVSRRASGYQRTGAGFVHAEFNAMAQPFAAGGLCSTVLDLVRWTRALWAGRVVPSADVIAMATPARLTNGPSTRYGFGLGVDSFEGHRRVMHAGAIDGFTSVLAHFPDDTLTIAILTNSQDATPGQLLDGLARLALGVALPSAPRDLPLTAAERATYVGTYGVPPRAFRVSEREGHLIVAPGSEGGGLSLYHQGNHRFVWVVERTMQVEFEVEGGRATALVLLGEGGRSLRLPRRADGER